MKNGIHEFDGKDVKEEKMRVDAKKREVISSNAVFGFLLYAGIAFALLIIVYGIDSIAPGAHDAFHDFRHVVGMPCH
ncbi:MAG: CbtB domain-containing protein [Nitrospinota bacterium]